MRELENHPRVPPPTVMAPRACAIRGSPYLWDCKLHDMRRAGLYLIFIQYTYYHNYDMTRVILC